MLEEWGIEPLNGELESESAWLVGVAAALAKIGEKAGDDAVHVGIPGNVALTKFVRTPAIVGARRAKAVEFEAAQNIPYALNEVVWDHLVLDESGPDLELMLAAAKVGVVEQLCAGADEAGLDVVQVTPACVALWHCLRWNHPESVAEGALLVQVGTRSTHLMFAHGARLFVRTLNQLSISADFPARLQAEMVRTIAHARRQGVVLEPRTILLNGALAELEAWRVSLGEVAKLPVRRFEPLRRVQLGARAVEEGASIVSGQLASAVGLAVAAREGERRPNLLPVRYRRAAEASRWKGRWKVAAVGVLAALTLTIWPIREAKDVAEARAEEMAARLGPWRAMERRVLANREKLERLEAREKQLRGVVEARTAWARFFAELQEVLQTVEDTWLDRLTIEETESRNGRGATDESELLRVTVSGRMLDRVRPTERANATSYEKVRRLLERLEASRSIAAVEHPRFDNRRAGVLGFDVTLVLEASWRMTASDEEAVR